MRTIHGRRWRKDGIVRTGRTSSKDPRQCHPKYPTFRYLVPLHSAAKLSFRDRVPERLNSLNPFPRHVSEFSFLLRSERERTSVQYFTGASSSAGKCRTNLQWNDQKSVVVNERSNGPIEQVAENCWTLRSVPGPVIPVRRHRFASLGVLLA